MDTYSQEELESLEILVIDDDESIRKLVYEVLTNEGHIVVPVGSAEEGLEQLPYMTFKIAYVDNRLPNMQGIVLCEYLRRNNPLMKIVLMTAHPDKSITNKAARIGINFLEKPFNIYDLGRIVREYKDEIQAIDKQKLMELNPNYYIDLSEILNYAYELFDAPNVPERLKKKVIKTVQASMHMLLSDANYNETDRSKAFIGLIIAKTFSIYIPKINEKSPYEVYDIRMKELGKHEVFKGLY
ncbi:MAG: response regulator [Candidatus Eremiobacterota bacterium]